MKLGRRHFLAGMSAIGTAAVSGCATATRSVSSDFRFALSVSPFTEHVLENVALAGGGATARTVRETQLLFNAHGATEVYARIGTLRQSPAGRSSEHGWERGLERARLARDLDMPFNPELGLFANYGDVAALQEAPDFSSYPEIELPAAWSSLTLDQMLPPLRAYGERIARQILDTGARVNVWDLGNEVEMGVAGVSVKPLVRAERYVAPDNVDPEIGRRTVMELIQASEAERIAWCRRYLWPHNARMFAALVEGIRAVQPDARFSTHISAFGQRSPAIAVAFWETMHANGYLPDELGISSWGTQGPTLYGPDNVFSWLTETASELHATFGRRTFIAEYGFPAGEMARPFEWNDPQPGYPQDEQGQFAYTRDVILWGLETGILSGVRPWAPDLCTSNWAPMSWFARDGEVAAARPVMNAFMDARPEARDRHPVRGAQIGGTA